MNRMIENQFERPAPRATRTKPVAIASTMSIQYWPSKPRKEKCSTRKCNASAPPMFWRKIGGLVSEIYYFYISEGDTTDGAAVIGRRRGQSAAKSSKRD